jgi:SPP1 family phage portal protein
LLTSEEIKSFIDNDAASTKKKLAKVGQRYYEADHDIRDYRIFYVDASGKLQEDKHRTNIKISHPFFTENVDQVVQYLLSGDGFVKSDNPELQTHLDTYFNDDENFTAELYETLTGCVSKGFEFMYAYKNADGRTAFQCADSLGVIEVEARFASDKEDHVLYWYIDRIDKDGKTIKRIQDWNKHNTVFYKQTDEGEIKKDEDEAINPRPHMIYTKGNDDAKFYSEYGFIPFFRIDNCKKQFSGLRPIKDLIDDYDLMSCGLSNNIQDTNEALYVVKGFQGDNLDELMQNIKAKKHIGVDEDGAIDIKTIDIPYQARQTKLDLDEKNIYRFGMALNTSGLKDTNATTNLAIKSAYSLLDLKANKLEIRLKQFMRKLLKVVLAEINDNEGTDYQQKDVYFNFERDIPVNEQEDAQNKLTDAQRKQTEITTLLNIATHLDNETMMQLICEQLDIDYDDIKDKLPDPEEAQTDVTNAQTVIDEIPVEPVGGDVI